MVKYLKSEFIMIFIIFSIIFLTIVNAKKADLITNDETCSNLQAKKIKFDNKISKLNKKITMKNRNDPDFHCDLEHNHNNHGCEDLIYLKKTGKKCNQDGSCQKDEICDDNQCYYLSDQFLKDIREMADNNASSNSVYGEGIYGGYSPYISISKSVQGLYHHRHPITLFSHRQCDCHRQCNDDLMMPYAFPVLGHCVDGYCVYPQFKDAKSMDCDQVWGDYTYTGRIYQISGTPSCRHKGLEYNLYVMYTGYNYPDKPCTDISDLV